LLRTAAVLAATTAAISHAQTGVEALKLGAAALDDGRHDEAVHLLERARQTLPQLADFAAFFTAQAQFRAKRFDQVPKLVEMVVARQAPSSVTGRAAVLGAEAALELNQPKIALGLLGRVPPDMWPQPAGFRALAKSHEASGDGVAAAAAWQSLWLRYPGAPEAAEAAKALERLEQALGAKYPPLMPQAMLERAAKLTAERQYKAARAEYERLSTSLGGLERERAQVGAGAVLLASRETARALEWLQRLRLTFPETEAERQFHLVTCFLRLDRLEEMIEAAAAASKAAPASEWRLKALIAAANRLLVENDFGRYTPLYQECADSFPNTEEGASCHWKTVWRRWLGRDPGAAVALQEHLRRFPNSDKAGAALHFLARDAESRGDAQAARRYFGEVVIRFPNSYYAVLARESLGRVDVKRVATKGSAADAFLAGVDWPVRERKADFQADAATSALIERGRLLARAELERWAEAEIRFASKNGAKPYPCAMALHEIATARGDHAQAIRYLLGTVNGYLWLDPDGAPVSFWRAAFPLPYGGSIRQYAAVNGLDPYLLAGLIRQESLFDPRVVSSAGAIGLTQVMPSTGRSLARRAGVRGYRVSLLKTPDANLKIGSYYLRQQLNQRNGSVEETLAGYNAGPGRVTRWKTWAEYKEPAEFIETIPFTQTRDYVQIIIRNAEMYRRLYSGEPLPAPLPVKEPTQKKTSGTPKNASKSKTKR
jgi:soluble lytic murein transglycosylase